MPNLSAGTRIYALDWPVSQYAEDATLQSNFASSGAYIEPTTPCRVTFTAPTTGRVKLIIGGGIADATNSAQGWLSAEIRETNISGAVVVEPNSFTHGIITLGFATDYCYQSRITILGGLRPGQTYFARVMVKSSLPSNTADLREKNIAVIPVP